MGILHCLPQQLLKTSLPFAIQANQNGHNVEELLKAKTLFPPSWANTLTDFNGWWLRISLFMTAEKTCQCFILKETHETWIINNLTSEKLALITKAILKKKKVNCLAYVLPSMGSYIDKPHIAREIWWPWNTLVTNWSMAIMRFCCISETASGFNLP